MNNLDDLQKKLGVKFNNQKLLNQALFHRSYLNENHQIKFSNERLEFLGDSVLSLLVSTKLYKRYPDYPEGKLTSIRSLLVKTKTLADLAQQLTLGDYLQMSRGEERGGGRQNPSLLADTLEAVIGAIYLDLGLEIVDRFLSKTLYPLISSVEMKEDLQDYKSTLQEVIQEKSKVSPAYRVLKEFGPDHDKTFTIGVFVENTLLSSGEGKSKQSAEQQAAKVALEDLNNVKSKLEKS